MNRKLFRLIGCIAAVLLGAGCSAPSISQQRLVSQPNMTFSPSPVWGYASRQLAQIETGLAFAGGGQGAGCTSCK